MTAHFELAARLAATALGKWTNEGAAGAPASPGSRHGATGQREAVAHSCSPNHGKDDDSVGDAWPSALRARKRWQALWLKP
jgi:hypothetical protein